MDELEASPNSRAKVPPPLEKHVMYQVHLPALLRVTRESTPVRATRNLC
jgi:hypothetical protein